MVRVRELSGSQRTHAPVPRDRSRGRCVALTALLLAGCGTVEFEAPPGARVRILRQYEPATVQMTQKIWYAGWGQWPLSNNSTAPLIAEKRLEEVRLATDQTFLDNIISSVASILSFSVRTLYVEGNPAAPPAPGAESVPNQAPPGGSDT